MKKLIFAVLVVFGLFGCATDTFITDEIKDQVTWKFFSVPHLDQLERDGVKKVTTFLFLIDPAAFTTWGKADFSSERIKKDCYEEKSELNCINSLSAIELNFSVKALKANGSIVSGVGYFIYPLAGHFIGRAIFTEELQLDTKVMLFSSDQTLAYSPFGNELDEMEIDKEKIFYRNDGSKMLQEEPEKILKNGLALFEIRQFFQESLKQPDGFINLVEVDTLEWNGFKNVFDDELPNSGSLPDKTRIATKLSEKTFKRLGFQITDFKTSNRVLKGLLQFSLYASPLALVSPLINGFANALQTEYGGNFASSIAKKSDPETAIMARWLVLISQMRN